MKFQANYNYKNPIRMLYGFINTNVEKYQIPIALPAKTDWGEMIPNQEFFITSGNKFDLELGWISLADSRTYYFRGNIELTEEIVKNDELTLVIGLGNQGELAIWIFHALKGILLMYANGIDISDKVTDQMIWDTNFTDKHGNRIKTLQKLCQEDLLKFDRSTNKEINTNIRSIRERMKRFVYRYDIKFVDDTAKTDFILFESLYDGTYDKTSDTKLLSFHESAKVKKMCIKWKGKDKGDEFSANFWFVEDGITSLFNKFYGVSSDTKADFIVRIDAENKKYELALYRQGLKEPVVIPETAYQLIVFKNKFEDFRSANYNQPRGAWIW